MSIINDALKKVQQGLSPAKPEKQPDTPPSGTSSKGSTFAFETPAPPVEILTPSMPTQVNQKPVAVSKIKSILAFFCALAIMGAAFWFVYQNFQNDIPHVKSLIKRTYNHFFHKKEEVPAFKTIRPEDLKPLAKITINPPAAPVTNVTPTASTPSASTATATVTPVVTAKPVSVTPANTATPLAPAPTVTATANAIPTANALPAVSTPETVKADAPMTLNVHGVMSNGTQNLALINDQVYQEGDDIDGIKIVKITLDSITISNNGKEETIRVKH